MNCIGNAKKYTKCFNMDQKSHTCTAAAALIKKIDEEKRKKRNAHGGNRRTEQTGTQTVTLISCVTKESKFTFKRFYQLH